MTLSRVLFLCTGNSCRSQMAEAFANSLLNDKLRAFSAGTVPGELNPFAVRVMAESGIDISKARPQHLDEFDLETLDLIVTVCDSARESCPVLPSELRLKHKSFEDPPALALGARNEEEALPHYRRVRDEIRHFLEAEDFSHLL